MLSPLYSALVQGAGGFGERLLQHPMVLAAGILIGVAAGLAAGLIVARARHGGEHASAPPPHSATQDPKTQNHLQTLAMAEVEKQLNTSPEGLTQAEAERRLLQYGPNELPEKTTNALLNFLRYFWGPIPWMIEAAVVLSGIVRHWPDCLIILALLFANAIIGYWEERQAGNAIEALKARLAINARVRRDGEWVTPPARQ
jgi:H+-transporting ATPase